MFINPIDAKSTSAYLPKSSKKPTFKRQNYVKVFTEQFNTKLTSDLSINNAFYVLNKACAFNGSWAIPFFKSHFNQSRLWKNLSRLRWENYDKAYDIFCDKFLKKPSSSIVLLKTEDDQPIVQLVNNGKYPEETFLSRLQRGNSRNVNIVFHELDGDKVIIFGTDYTGDGYLSRGTVSNPAMLKETFYNAMGGEGPIKQRVTYAGYGDNYNVENFNKDGSKYTTTDNFLSDFVSTIKGW